MIARAPCKAWARGSEYASPLQVFISYRRTDAQSASRQLAEALKLRFGQENVFLDTRDIATGAEWRSDTLGRVQTADVVLAIIGPHWAEAADDRSRRSVLERGGRGPGADGDRNCVYARGDCDPSARGRRRDAGSGDPATPIQAARRCPGTTLHHTSWDRDVEALAEALSHLSTRPKPWEPSPETPASKHGPPGRTDAERVAGYIGEGSVVAILGSGANAVDRDAPWEQGAGSLPDTAELARHLALRFRVGSETDDLARVSQHVSLTEGRVDLYRTLRELLVKADHAPSSVHRFVARVPGRLRELGRESYQLVVTTNYDTALERAFDAVHEPYDLAVFVATGEHRGRFVHVPWWDPEGRGARPITVPNEYVDLPIDEDGELERTVIVKLHGGPANLGPSGPTAPRQLRRHRGRLHRLPDAESGESLIPLQILDKIRESHFLFLGYRMRDWNLRVFLQRVWGEQQLRRRPGRCDPGLDTSSACLGALRGGRRGGAPWRSS